MKQQVVQTTATTASYLSQQQQQQQHHHPKQHSKQQHSHHHGHFNPHSQNFQQFEESFPNKSGSSMIPTSQVYNPHHGNALTYPHQQQQHQHQQQQHGSIGDASSMINPLQMNYEQTSYFQGSSGAGQQGQQFTSHKQQHQQQPSQQQMAQRFCHPHHIGFHQNNKQQDMHSYQQNYQQQQQQSQVSFGQTAASSQQIYHSTFQQNISRVNNPLSYPQLQNQWHHQSNHSQQQQHQIQQQHHFHNQNQQQQSSIQSLSSDSQLKLQSQQPEEQGSPSSVLLVMVFELKDLSINNDHIQQIFLPYGFVNKVLIFVKNPDQTKAFVEMDTIESAKKAKEALNKAKIPLTPNQKYKFKVHYSSQTSELNLCNYKTEGKDYRLLQPAGSKNINPAVTSIATSPPAVIQQENQLSKQQSTKVSPVISGAAQSTNSPPNSQTIGGGQNYTKQSSNTQLPSSSYSIPSPTNRKSTNSASASAVGQKTSATQQGNSILHNNHHHYKNISNSIGQTIGAITYVEKVQQNGQTKEDQHSSQQYNAIIAPPNGIQVTQTPNVQQNKNTSYPINSQLNHQGIQAYTNSLQSLTSTSTPTSQGNTGGSQIQKVSTSQTALSSNRNESGIFLSSEIALNLQALNLNGNNQQAQDEIAYFEEGDFQRSPFDQKTGISSATQSCNGVGGISSGLNGGIASNANGMYQGSSSLFLTKLESCESFNQVYDQGNMSNQNLPEFNLQSLGPTNINNPSNLSQSLIDISPRKGSLVLINSEMILQQSQQQDNNYQTPNSQITQLMQQNDHRIPSQTHINRQSMVDSTHYSKSTCSTSSPSPFHTSHHGVTPPTHPNSSKIHSSHNFSKLEHLQLNQVDISSNNVNNIPLSAGVLHNLQSKQYSQPQQQLLQQQCVQQQQQQTSPHIFSTPLIQETSLDFTSSSNPPYSTNTLQDDVNNSQFFSLNTLSHQESLENAPLQSISHQMQQQQSEESPVIYIKNIMINELQPENIYNVFRNFGYVHSVLFLKDNKTILIQYEESSQAKMAINQLNNVNFIGDDQMRITYGKRKNIVLPPNLIGSKGNLQQNNGKPSGVQSPSHMGGSSNIKQSDYFINKNNDPRCRAGSQNSKKNTFYNPASRTVYVTNIPLQLVQQEQDLLNIFKPYGTVTKHNILVQEKKVTAFIEFDSLQTALKTICFLHNTPHYGKLIQIFFTRTMLK